MTPTEIKRIVQQLLVIGTNVQQDRQSSVGVNAGAYRVERKLADWYAHATNSQISQTQDPFAIGDNNHIDICCRRIVEQLLDFVLIWIGNVEPARATEELTVLLTPQTHRWCVDDRHHLGDVFKYQPVEERFITILKCS